MIQRRWDYDGGENQPIDPLIGSIEGFNATPAYRGLALAVFENLELAEYGNRIPFLTFEVAADAAAPALSEILSDASAGLIQSTDERPIKGYAAHGSSIAASVGPLLNCFDVALFDDGTALRSPADAPPVSPDPTDLGATVTGPAAARFERERVAARDLPVALSLTYYDPARDYQTSLARASVCDQIGNETPLEFPAVMDASDARSLVEAMIAQKWARRDSLKLRLPPKFISLEPGRIVTLDLSPHRWRVESCTIDGMTAVAELRPASNASASIEGDAGRSNVSADTIASPVTLAAIEMADPVAEPSSGPGLFLAASSPDPSWRAVPVEVTAGGYSTMMRTARTKAVIGHAVTKLGRGHAKTLDLNGSVEVQLIDQEQWLVSCDEEALAGGANLAALGGEVLQFEVAEPLGSGRFRLRRFIRGRLGTEWAMGGHAVGETFVRVDLKALEPVRLPPSIQGSSVDLVPRGRTGGAGVSVRRHKRSGTIPVD